MLVYAWPKARIVSKVFEAKAIFGIIFASNMNILFTYILTIVKHFTNFYPILFYKNDILR